MGNELDQTRLAALNQAAHDLKGMAEAKEVVERANVYLTFLTAGEPEKALEKNRLIARHQWDFVNDCPASETMTLGEPPAGPHPLSDVQPIVERFLSWRLPEDFQPDNGIKFYPVYNVEHMASQGKPPMRHEPTGTNLFSYDQAEAMIRHILGMDPCREI